MLKSELIMSAGDMVDKYSILSMKVQFDKSLTPLYGKYMEAVSSLLSKHAKDPSFLAAFTTLIEINAKIWVMEASLRNEFVDDPAVSREAAITLEQIGKIAVTIRGYNIVRVTAKAAIDAITGGVPEEKFEHMSIQNQVTEERLREVLG
jgi:hypothetical protein